MQDTLDGLTSGLGLAVIAIFLLLAAYFQSIKIALIVIGTIPAVIAGVALGLFVTGSTLNVQSFMGAIMAIGVAVANAILLATFAEQYRQEGAPADTAAIRGATSRLRPILMTTFAMIAGMIPVAVGAEQLAPLGRAVIGGLAASTVATLFVLPALFALVQRRATAVSPSLDPDDVMSRHYSGEHA
jgi:multidrug efflux pump subunit AcrB